MEDRVLVDIVLFGGYSSKQRTYFTRQFATMLDAGLPITEALRILKDQQKAGPFRQVVESLYQQVRHGDSLASALSKYPKAFDTMYVRMVEVGEKSGKLEEILDQLAVHMEKRRRLRRKIIGAMIYPTLVMSFAIFVLVGIRYVILPMVLNISL